MRQTNFRKFAIRYILFWLLLLIIAMSETSTVVSSQNQGIIVEGESYQIEVNLKPSPEYIKTGVIQIKVQDSGFRLPKDLIASPNIQSRNQSSIQVKDAGYIDDIVFVELLAPKATDHQAGETVDVEATEPLIENEVPVIATVEIKATGVITSSADVLEVPDAPPLPFSWISEVPWISSGIGVFVLTVLWIIWRGRRKKGSNNYSDSANSAGEREDAISNTSKILVKEPQVHLGIALSGAQVDEIRKAILSGYKESTLRQMIRIELDENLDEIAGGNNFSDIVFELITWAEKEGLVQKLISAAHRDKPNNAMISHLSKKYNKGA